MAVPKRRKTRSKRGMRRSHTALNNQIALSIDPTTGETHRRHHLSLKDGYYRGKQILIPQAEKED